jgi:2'-5' RNA ligase
MIGIRAFIGIDFDPDCKKYIFDLQQSLKKYAARGRWKHSSNFHLTLKFLDEISPAQKELIDAGLRDICKARRPFSLEIDGAGVFHGRDTIRVLWLGLGGDMHVLRYLAADIDKSVSMLGFPAERRPFTPHITIGQDIIFPRPFEEIRDSIGKISYGPVKATCVNLFKSEQIQGKRIYTKISEYPLEG